MSRLALRSHAGTLLPDSWRRFAMVAACVAMTAMATSPVFADDSADSVESTPTISVFASGLNSPRGLKFGPDGDLYVAEAGIGGNLGTTPAQCQQIPVPIGPYKGSLDGSRVSKINRYGQRSTVADGLPSSQTATGETQGAADVAFIGRRLYVLTAGSGCSHGLAGTYNAVLRVNRDGSTTPIANLSRFWLSHPTAVNQPADFEPDGTPYSMIAVRGDLYVVEPNHGEIDKVSRSGRITRVVDLSAILGHVVPTAITREDGDFYVGNLNTFPIVDGSSHVWKLDRRGHIAGALGGFTTVLGVAFDDRGRLFVLENTTGNSFPTPNTGRIVRVDGRGDRQVIASGLLLPTAMTFGPDGNLYVSVFGFGGAPGSGQVLKVDLD